MRFQSRLRIEIHHGRYQTCRGFIHTWLLGDKNLFPEFVLVRNEPLSLRLLRRPDERVHVFTRECLTLPKAD
jgi:hypothetical protein